jgi:hypothetical protein
MVKCGGQENRILWKNLPWIDPPGSWRILEYSSINMHHRKTDLAWCPMAVLGTAQLNLLAVRQNFLPVIIP